MIHHLTVARSSHSLLRCNRGNMVQLELMDCVSVCKFHAFFLLHCLFANVASLLRVSTIYYIQNSCSTVWITRQ
uniref:Uncharacterized protein n=1 Tax=Arundo donax TaxID=35708 RepID=A0A0A9AKK6_ARUDO